MGFEMFSIATDDNLHKAADEENRPKRIAMAHLIGYSWGAIADYWKISVLTAKFEAADFMRKEAERLGNEILGVDPEKRKK